MRTAAIILAALAGLCLEDPNYSSSCHAFLLPGGPSRQKRQHSLATRHQKTTGLSSRLLSSFPQWRLHSQLMNIHDLSSLSLDQLRDALKRRGLATSGNKAELLDRLRVDIRRAYNAEMAEMGLVPPPSLTRSKEATMEEKEELEEEEVGGQQGDISSRRGGGGGESRTRRGKGTRGGGAGKGGGVVMEDEEGKTPEELLAAAAARAAAAAGGGDGGVQGEEGSAASSPPPSSTDDMEDMILDSLPDYGKSPKHVIKERHVGWDGALQGYTLGDGTYVEVKEDTRLSEADLQKMDAKFRQGVKTWEEEYPDDWADFMALCDAAAGAKSAATSPGRRLGDGEEVGEVDELEQMVRDVERLERERQAMKIPMAKAMEEWESQLALAREVTVIEKEGEKKKSGRGGGKEEKTTTTTDPRHEEEEEEEVVVMEEGEQEYVPIDAMFRDELDFQAADGTMLKGYLVSSKLAQKFWRREERPVVLLLTDKCGWRNVQTRKLADHMAFLTNHVFFVPDLYRDDPWPSSPTTTSGGGEDDLQGGREGAPRRRQEEEEQWRQRHPTLRILQDAKCAMETLAKNYNATAKGMVGFGMGGGQVLSAVASGYIAADAVVALCPHGYDATKVMNSFTTTTTTTTSGATPTFTVFAGKDEEVGGRLDDALVVMDGFASNPALPYMLRVFKDEGGSFIMQPRGGHEDIAEDALMLATSWLEIHMRPSAGGRVKLIRDVRVC